MYTLTSILMALAGLFSPVFPPQGDPPSGEGRIDSVIVVSLCTTSTTVTSEVLIAVDPDDTIRSMISPGSSPGSSTGDRPDPAERPGFRLSLDRFLHSPAHGS